MDVLKYVITLLVGSGTIAWIVKQLFSQILSRDIEHFKANLRTTALEHEIRFSRLHDRRVEVIAELYKRLARADTAFVALTKPLRVQGESFPEQLRTASHCGKEFMDYLNENRVWLSDPLCQLLEALNNELRLTWVDITLRPDRAQAWVDAWEKIEDRVPQVRRQIEQQMQEMLGAVLPGKAKP